MINPEYGEGHHGWLDAEEASHRTERFWLKVNTHCEVGGNIRGGKFLEKDLYNP